MANIQKSQRGTSWRNWFTDNAFRRGFTDRRSGLCFAAEYDSRSEAWQWMYEAGRLFAADPTSRRFKRMPEKGEPIKPTLVKAYRMSLANRAY